MTPKRKAIPTGKNAIKTYSSNQPVIFTNSKYIKNKQQIFPGIVLPLQQDNKIRGFKEDLVMRNGRIVPPNKYDKEVFVRSPLYRFWYFRENKMFYPEDIKSMEFSGTPKQANFKIKLKSNPKKSYSSTDGVLMEYTHIEDKKGNRLCEGDILRDGMEIFYLYYDPNKSAFETKPFDCEVPFSIGMNFDRADGTEIIGNVYENLNMVNNRYSLEIARFYDFENKKLTKENKKFLLEQGLLEEFIKTTSEYDIFNQNNELSFANKLTEKLKSRFQEDLSKHLSTIKDIPNKTTSNNQFSEWNILDTSTNGNLAREKLFKESLSFRYLEKVEESRKRGFLGYEPRADDYKEDFGNDQSNNVEQLFKNPLIK